MTQLLNLESCSEYYQNTLLLQQSPQDFIPKAGLPTAYKNLLRTYAHTAYLPQPTTSQILSQNLTINTNLLETLTIGRQLNEGSERLFIIRDTVDLMTLLAVGFISNQEKYLYASAYYYWNHLSQISKQNINRPLVFINLDSFDNEGLIPISFAQPQNSRYPVPLLDTKQEKINLKFDSVKTYESVLEAIAKAILNDNFSARANDLSTIYHLVQYLQKTLFVQYVQSNIAQQQFFDFIIEILYQDQIFYKQVNVNLDTIQKIIIDTLDIELFQNLANGNPQFALTSIAEILFSPSVMQQSANCGFWSEYLKMLTRIAITEDLQRLYFGYFLQQDKNQATYYKLDNYLWGYWCILLWYADFKQLHQWLDYKQHFKLILSYLAKTSENQFKGHYKINAFASLIYLLTFREFDSEFCQPNSEEIKLAQQVIKRFQNDTSIKIRQVSNTKFLNVYFAELIAGIATESDMVNLLSAS